MGGLPFAVCCSRPYIVYQTVKKLHFCLIACVGATIGRPPTYRSNAFFGLVCLQGKRARASNARPYKSFSTVWGEHCSPLPICHVRGFSDTEIKRAAKRFFALLLVCYSSSPQYRIATLTSSSEAGIIFSYITCAKASVTVFSSFSVSQSHRRSTAGAGCCCCLSNRVSPPPSLVSSTA